MMNRQEIAGLIDHTLLRPDANEQEIRQICNDAETYGFYSVCIHPFFIGVAKALLFQKGIKVATVIGFPLGMTLPKVKVYEAQETVFLGADELDIVVNIGECKSGNWEMVRREVSAIIKATPRVTHKIIIEAHYLRDDEKVTVSRIAMDCGAEFIKTSTGFCPGGATIRDIGIIRDATGGRVGIKAAGGIRTLKDVLGFLDAGADRIGTSSGAGIMRELQSLEKTGDN